MPDEDEGMIIEGERSKRFSIYRMLSNGEPYERVAGFDTPEEVLAYKRRLDWITKVRTRGKYLTFSEFEEWAKDQKASL